MFLDIIPAEVRISIYHVIIERTIVIEDPSKRQGERLYGGLIFSCKQVLAKYNFEAEKRMPPFDPDMHAWSFDLNLPPVLIAPPSPLSYPTHMHISVPATFYLYEETHGKNPEQSSDPIFDEVTAHHTRVTFSLYDTEALGSKMRVCAALARLYSIICDRAIENIENRPDGPHHVMYQSYPDGFCCDFDEAERTWIEKGYDLGRGDAPPFYNCDYVVLYMKREVVAFDARMSKDELKCADSSYLWEEGNAIREDNIARMEEDRSQDEQLKAWSEKLRLRWESTSELQR